MQETEKPNSNNSRRRMFIVVLLSAVMVSALFAFWYYNTHRYIAGKITFQQFEPSYLPTGMRITDRNIHATYTPSASPARYTQLVFDMSDDSTIIEQERENQAQAYACPPGQVTNQTCTLGHTSKGEPYLLFTTTYDSGEIDQSFEWSRQDTDIRFNLQNVPERGYSSKEIEKIIESFKPVNHKNLDVKFIDHSTI